MKTKHLSSKRRVLVRALLLVAAIMLWGNSQQVSAQWTTSGTNVYYNGGNVGIGTNTPGVKLEVSGTPSTSGNLFKFSGADSNGNLFNEIASTGIGGAILKLSGGSGTPFYLQSTGSGSGAGNNKFVIGTASSGLFSLQSDGNVGIGTTNPQSNLQIGTQASASSASPGSLSLGGTYSNSAGANLKLKLYDDGVTANTYGLGVSSGSMDFGVSPSAGYNWYAGSSNKMSLSNSGNLTVSGIIAAKYQDVAEWVPSSEQIAAGTVVVLDTTKSNQVISSTQSYDTRVAGVVSEQPGIALGESGKGKVLVATTGRVLVNVVAMKGPIHIGDLLVTSDISGVAMKSEPITIGNRKMHMPGTLIGKALEPLEKGSGKILVLLSLQ